ncbi:MAG: hypothetical protein V1725_07665 [archaeon]
MDLNEYLKQNPPNEPVKEFVKDVTTDVKAVTQKTAAGITGATQRAASGMFDFFQRTKAELLIGAIGFGLMAGIMSYQHEKERGSVIPTVFSEKTQIIKDAEARGEDIGPWTDYLTSVNDMTMKIFEAHTLAAASGEENFNLAFAEQLERKLDPTLEKHNFMLDALLDSIPIEATRAYVSLQPFIDAALQAGKLSTHLSAAWDDSHWDSYHTEYSTSIDEDGNTTTTSYEVYDYTTHSYDYYSARGKAAVQEAHILLEQPTVLLFDERLLPSNITHEQNENAIRRSLAALKRDSLSANECAELAAYWKTGSTLMINLPKIISVWPAVRTSAQNWIRAEPYAHSDSYITYSHFDDGPREFQVAEQGIDRVAYMTKNLSEILGGVQYTMQNAPELKKMILDYEEAVLQRHERPDGQRKDLLLKAFGLYEQNFKNGFDVRRFRPWMVVLWSFLGVSGGLGIGALADVLIGSKERYYR